MNLDRKRFPIIDQVQRGKFDFPMAYHDFNMYSPYLSTVRGVVLSKPRVDYLCTNRMENVVYGGYGLPAEWLYEAQGVLLFQESALVYRVKQLNENSWEFHIYLYQGDRLSAYCNIKTDGIFDDVVEEPMLRVSGVLDPVLLTGMVNLLLCYLYFREHVQIQDKVVSTKKSRICQTSSGSVKTDYKYPINVIDVLYYTNLIKGQGFPVKGHLRHIKKSDKTVFVKPFQKSGYTRQAKKLTLAA
jgi:hypothetical protein